MGLGMGLCLCVRQTFRLEQRLELTPPRVRGIPGTKENLRKVLSEYPQMGRETVHYVLAGGWAAELWSGRNRPHHDIDIVVLNPKYKVETDNQRPKSYFGQISISCRDFRRNCIDSLSTDLQITGLYKKAPLVGTDDDRDTWFDPAGEVVVASPEFLTIGKLSGGQEGQPARETDLFDAAGLLCGEVGRKLPPMSEDSARLVFNHVKGLPHKRIASFTEGFMALSRASYGAPLRTVEANVREFHEILRDAVGPNREGGIIERGF